MARCWIAAVTATFSAAACLTPAHGAAPARDPAAAMARVAADLKRCANAPEHSGTMAQNGCYSDALGDADKILAAAVQAMLAQLAANSAKEADRARDDREIARRLEAAQRAWVSYRKAECSFTATDMLGGTGEAASGMACEFTETQARVKRLADWLKDNPAQP